MTETILWIVFAVLAVAILAIVIVRAVEIFKMSPDERKKALVTYIKGLVALAEAEIGSGHGQEKQKKKKKWFKEKAPLVLKICLSLFGKENLKELIELALKEIKENFGK